jgi:alpha-L-fucosidase
MDKYGFRPARVPEPDVDWAELARPVPEWFPAAKLGIMIHWGAYSVPAWAEPTGELGTVDGDTWFRHNPYAEWYWNTIRFKDSPAREHHRSVYGDAAYDDFLDDWSADEFDPASWLALFARAGARYIVPVAKHHDGIALWNAPGTGTRNTVVRGPRRDLVREIATETRRAGLRFGVYYSGGLDWQVTDLPAHDMLPDHDIFTSVRDVRHRPVDAAYAAYAYLQVRDLIDRYRPSVLWNDIEWPDAGKHAGAFGLMELLRYYYAEVPDGVVNDRWGDTTHWDFRTSEYQAHLDKERDGSWENCRGIGMSFGYNRIEDERHLLTPASLCRHLADVVSRGGNLLLNVGPTASGVIPQAQRAILSRLGDWMARCGPAIHDTRPLPAEVARSSDEPWVRWTRADDHAWAIIGSPGPVRLDISPGQLDTASATTATGEVIQVRQDGDGAELTAPPLIEGLPTAVRFALRHR